MNPAFAQQLDAATRIPGQPIPIKPAVASPGDYPIDALCDRLRDAALAIHQKVQLPLAIAAQSVLSTAALAVQAHVDARMPTGQVVPVSLFCVTVARSGERKSSADYLAGKPIRAREAELRELYARQNEEHLADAAAYTASRKKAVTGTKSRAQIKQELEACGEEPIAPPMPLLATDEGTLAGLQKLFAEAMPSLGLFSDEGGQWLGGHAFTDENRAATGAALSNFWDGKPIKRVRGGEGVSFLIGRRLSLHLMVQPRISARLFGDEDLRDQGLLSRLLVCHPTSAMGARMWRDADGSCDTALDRYETRVHSLLSSPLPCDPKTRELKPRVLQLSPSARDLWVKWHDAVEAENRQGGTFEPISGFAGKLPEHSLRIAAVMAYFEDRNVVEISDRAMASGIKLAQFYANEALRLFGIGGADVDTDNAAKLIEWIRAEKLPIVGARFLSRVGPGRSMTAPVRKRAILMLEENGHFCRIQGGAEIEYRGKVEPNREAYTVVDDGEGGA